MALLDFDYKIAASLINCEQNVIKAVAAIESNGGGFLTDLRIKILFEPHIFLLTTSGFKNRFHEVSKGKSRYLLSGSRDISLWHICGAIQQVTTR